MHKKLKNKTKAVLLLILLIPIQGSNQSLVRVFQAGEKLSYIGKFGILNAGNATLTVSDSTFYIRNRPSLKVDLRATSVGLVHFFYKINDNWGSYIDANVMQPLRFYRHISEGRYRFHEVVNFYPDEDTVRVSKLDRHTQKLKRIEKHKVPDGIHDPISGYYYLRTLDASTLSKGDTLNVEAFFDDKIYDFKIGYTGEDTVKTKLGNIPTLTFLPILQDNKFFKSDTAIKLWISNDSNKIPVKISAKFLLGTLDVELVSANNLGHKLKLEKSLVSN